MSNVLNFSAFESAACNTQNLDAVRGGASTGGGCTPIGGGKYIRWECDETNGDGCTDFEGVTMCDDPCE